MTEDKPGEPPVNGGGQHKSRARRQRRAAASVEFEAMQAARADMELDDKYELNQPRLEDW